MEQPFLACLCGHTALYHSDWDEEDADYDEEEVEDYDIKEVEDYDKEEEDFEEEPSKECGTWTEMPSVEDGGTWAEMPSVEDCGTWAEVSVEQQDQMAQGVER